MRAKHGACRRHAGLGLVESIARRLGHFVCGLSGHDLLRSYESGRICLRCASCTYETPGWTIDKPGRPVPSGLAQAPAAARPPVGRIIWDAERLRAMRSPAEG